jgi:hypothetical protein
MKRIMIPIVLGIVFALAIIIYIGGDYTEGPQIIDIDESSKPIHLNATHIADIVRTSPANGESGVSPTRETTIDFNQPISFIGLKPDIISAWFGTQKLEARLHVSPNDKTLTLFYNSPLPNSARIRVKVDGNGLIGQSGKPIDADGDGNPGGVAVIIFDTLSLTRIPGTEVWGHIFDSYQKNPDGSDKPIIGATIRVDALPEANAVSDHNGYFILKDMPAPAFFVHIDGGTAINPPPGSVYATVGKSLHSVPGQSVQLMMDGQSFNVYLPTISQGDIQPLSQSTDTDIGFGEAGKSQLVKMFPAIDLKVWQQAKVTFPPNSAVDDLGNPVTEAVIIPVPANRLPAPLPPNTNHQLDVAVMAKGATNFDTPAPACFPNLPDPVTGNLLPPGSKSALWSYNHDTGRWEINGQMTVSEDASMVCTNPGVGIRAPGWHGTNPGTVVKGGEIVIDTPSEKDSGVAVLVVDEIDPEEKEEEKKPAKIIRVGYYFFEEGERVDVDTEEEKLPYFIPIYFEVEFDSEPDSSQRTLEISGESFTLESTDNPFVVRAKLGIITPPLGEPLTDSQ